MTFRPSIVHAHSLVLLVLAGLFINQWWDLRELASRSMETSPLSPHVESLDQQQALLRSDVDALSDGRFLSAERYQADQRTLIEQIRALKHPAADAALLQSLQQDLVVLRADVEVVQKALNDVRRLAEQTPAPAVKQAPQQSKPKKPTVPFAVLGIEYRGGESFLAVAPLQNTQLQDVQLLRPGESRADWQLRSLTATRAQFGLPNGRTQTFNLGAGGVR